MADFKVIKKDKLYQVNTMCDEEIIIDKLYGATIFTNLKITAILKGNEAYWLVERMNIKTGIYEEPIKIDAQRDSEFSKEDEL